MVLIDDKGNKNRQVEVVDSIGVATDLLRQQGTLYPYNAWMGISTSKRTYPDERVMKYIEWASKHSPRFTLAIADYIQAYNKVPFSHKGWDKLDDWEYFKPALERKAQLEKLVQEKGLSNVEVKLMLSEMMRGLERESWENEFKIDYCWQLFDSERQQDGSLNQDIERVTKEKAAHILERAEREGINPEHALFTLSCYTQEEIFVSAMLASLGVANIKVGPVWEKPYDEITLGLLTGRGYKPICGEAEFGAVYLE